MPRPLALACAVLICAASLQATAQEPRVLRWTSQGDALTLDPHAVNEAPTIALNGQIYELLVSRDPALNLVPELATEWTTIAPDVWEFKLRPDVTFHGGEAFTAEDVAFSIARAQSATSNFQADVAAIASVEIVDDLTVRVHTTGPNPLLPVNLTSVFIMDKGWSEANGVAAPLDYAASQETFATLNANGTGPFKLESRAPDELTVLNANPDWWGIGVRPGNIGRIEYRPIKNPATRVATLLSGETDFLLDPPVQDIAQIAATAGLTVQTAPQIRTIFFGLDVASAELRTSDIKGKNPFADLRVRQAINMAIDREAIKAVVMDGMSFPAGQLVAPGVRGHTAELDAVTPLDAEKAKALLAEAGYPDGFSVRLDCPNDRYINDAAICEAAVGMLAKIGIRVNLEALPKAQHFPKVQDKVSDFYLLGWGVPTLDSAYAFQYLLEKSGAWNASGYDNPRLNEIVTLIGTETDVAKRDALIAEGWAIEQADLPYIPIHHQLLSWAMADRLTLPISADDIPRFAYAVMP